MFSYTIEDYLRLERIFFRGKKFKVSDIDVEYHYEVRKKHQKHDKIVRDILNNKEEVVKIINRYVKPEDKLRKEEMKEVREKLKNEEGSDIMHVHEVLRRDRLTI